MEKEIAEKVIEKLGSVISKGGRFVQFSDHSYKPVELSRDNFRKIEEKGDARTAFIDGGNNTIVEAANFSLQFARVYSTTYSSNKREKSSKKEFFVLVSSSEKEGRPVLDIDIFGDDARFGSFDAFDKTLARGKHRINPGEIAAACRKIIELKEAAKLADELGPGDVVVLDRDLQASITGEKEALDELYAKAEQNNVAVCGISKTTRLFTETGDSAAAAVSAIAPDSGWVYMPVAEIDNDGHKAEICFVKLHEKSKYVFRFEIYRKQKDEIMKVLGILKKNSKDPVFLGYPYGLIEADKMARVSNDEAEYLKVKLTSKAGDKRDKIIDYMKTVDAHSVLDNIS